MISLKMNCINKKKGNVLTCKVEFGKSGMELNVIDFINALPTSNSIV